MTQPSFRLPVAAIGRTVLSLPLPKYSYSPFSYGDQWNVLRSSDVFVNLESEDRPGHANQQMRLCIVQGTRDLLTFAGQQVIPIEVLVREASAQRRSIQQLRPGTPHGSADSLSVYAMERGTLLAIKYKAAGGQVHRVSLQFETTEDRERLAIALKDMDMYFAAAPPKQVQPEREQGSVAQVASSKRSVVAHQSGERPQSDPRQGEHVADSVFSTTEMTSPFAIPSVPPVSSPWQIRPPSYGAFSETHHSDFPRPEHSARAKSSHLPRSSTDDPLMKQNVAMLQPTINSNCVYPSIGHPDMINQGARPEDMSHSKDIAAQAPIVLPARTGSTSRSLFSETMNDEQRGQSALLKEHSSRLSRSNFVTDYESRIPPRRELPFANPDKSAARPSSSAKGLPPLPRPTVRGERSEGLVSANSNRMPQRSGLSSYTRQAARTDSSFYNTEIASPEGALKLNPPTGGYNFGRNVSGKYISSIDNSNSEQSSVYATCEEPSSCTELPSDTGILPHAEHPSDSRRRPLQKLPSRTLNSRRRTDSTKDADHEIVDQHGTFLSRPETSAPDTDKSILADYAAQTTEQRINVLNDFICESLENENFIKLCTDVDACWRRIGLGL